MAYPHTFVPLEEKINEKVKIDFQGLENGLITSEPNEFILSPIFQDFAEEIYTMDVRKDDIWIITFPRSGTTVTQEMIWLIMNNMDIEGAKEQLEYRVPYLEGNAVFKDYSFEDFPNDIQQKLLKISKTNPEYYGLDKIFKMKNTISFVKELPSARIIKSHLPLGFLPPNLLDTCKVIYVVRNPKDVLVSYYHLSRFLDLYGFQQNFSEYFEYFINGTVIYGPYWSHILPAWNRRHHPNMKFLFYEDIIKEMPFSIGSVAAFLGKEMSEADTKTLCDHLHISNFRKNPAVNLKYMTDLYAERKDDDKTFVRKGVSGGWKNYLTVEMNERMDKWILDNIGGTDFTFYCNA